MPFLHSHGTQMLTKCPPILMNMYLQMLYPSNNTCSMF